jgi:hypothetical protein
MLGYAKDVAWGKNYHGISVGLTNSIVNFKDAYIVVNPATNARTIRSDCIWELYPKGPSLLSTNPAERDISAPILQSDSVLREFDSNVENIELTDATEVENELVTEVVENDLTMETVTSDMEMDEEASHVSR